MLNALTIDLEDYFQVHAFSSVVRFEDWCNFECRVERNADRLLELLDGGTGLQEIGRGRSIQATFFVLGWIADRFAHVVRRIRKEGHEIACHGYAHRVIYHQSREEFREDVRRAKSVLQDVIGEAVIGYRAPSYSITSKSLWALEVLMEEGFYYDSSIFPIHHDFYGLPSAPRFPFFVTQNGNGSFTFSELERPGSRNQDGRATRSCKTKTPMVPKTEGCSGMSCLIPDALPRHFPRILEFPISTFRIFGQNIPVSGGGYFRLFPYRFIEQALMRINRKEKMPFMFYIHPWELDGDQPRIRNAPSRSTFRHYVNLNKTEGRLKRLLQRFDFSSMREILDNLTRRDESV